MNKITLLVSEQVFDVFQLTIKEEVCSIYYCSVVISVSHDVSCQSLLSRPATIRVDDTVVMAGIVNAVKAKAKLKHSYRCWLSIKSKLILSEENVKSNVFLDHTLHDLILTAIQPGFNDLHLRWHALKNPCFKYKARGERESGYQFLKRLTYDNKLYFWVDTQDDQEVIHISDQNALPLLYGPYALEYCPRDGTCFEMKVFEVGLMLKVKKADFKIWQLVDLNATRFDPQYSGQYRVIKCLTCFDENTSDLHQSLYCIPVKNICPLKPAKTLFIPFCFEAKVKAKGEYADLNKQGQYLIWPNSKRLSRVLNHANCHLPLYDGTRVLMTCLNGDIDDPVILAVLGCDNLVLKSLSDNRFIIPSHLNMNLSDAKKLELSTQGSSIQLNQQSQLHSSTDALMYQAKRNINISVANQYRVDAKQSIYLKSLDAMQWRMSTSYLKLKSCSISASAISLKVGVAFCDAKKFNLSAASMLYQIDSLIMNAPSSYVVDELKISAQHGIFFESGNSCLHVLPEEVILKSKTIQLSANDRLTLKGRVDYQSRLMPIQKKIFKSQLPIFKPIDIEPVNFMTLIKDASWSVRSAQLYDEVFACFTLLRSSKKEISIHVKTNRDKVLLTKPVNPQSGKVRVPWSVFMNKAECEDFEYFTFDVQVDRERFASNAKLLLRVDLILKLFWQNQEQVDEAFTLSALLSFGENRSSLYRRLKAVFQNIESDVFHLSSAPALEFYAKKNVYHKLPMALRPSIKAIQKKIDCFYPSLLCELTKSPCLDERSLYYLQLMSKAKIVTLFVHGFDVGLGGYPKYIDYVFSAEGIFNKLNLVFSETERTVHQTINQLKCKHPSLSSASRQTIEDSFRSQGVNGEGAKGWFVSMEHNLFKLNNRSFDQYERIVGVAWDSVPSDVLDYISIVDRVQIFGVKLSTLMNQLHSYGYRIHLIAHSLGCGVALHALANVNQAVTKVIFWEPAIPANVFSKSNSPWSMPAALNGFKKLLVLHSQNDNVLGPLPKSQPVGLSQYYVNSKKPFYSEFLPAILLTYLGLGSVYHAAMTVGVPAAALFDADDLAPFYEKWHELNPHVRDRNGRLLPKTFMQRVEDEQQYYKLVLKKPVFFHLTDNFEKNREQIKRYLYARKNLSLMKRFVRFSVFEEIANDGTIKNMFELRASEKYMRWVGQVAWWTEFVVLINTFFFDDIVKQAEPAMGYLGLNMDDIKIRALVDQGRIQQCDQTRWLYQHSGMREPSNAVLAHVYKSVIKPFLES